MQSIRKSKQIFSPKTMKTQQRWSSHSYPHIPGFKNTLLPHKDSDISTHPRYDQIFVRFLQTTGIDRWYLNLMGYRRYGLRFEDLIVEADDVGKAYTRLPKEVLSDRDDRVKQAFILHSGGRILPKEQWTTDETDIPYLSRYLEQVVQERRDREAFRPK